MAKRIVKLMESQTVLSVSEAMENFLKFKVAQGISELTLRDYQNTFEKFKNYSSGTMEFELLKSEILKFLTDRANGSPAKYNRPYSNMTAFLSWAVRQKIIDKNPIIELELKKRRDDGRIRCVDVDKIKKLLSVTDLSTYTGLRDYTMICLMLDSGIRPCEMCRLTTSDIDFSAGVIVISKYNSKTRTQRILPLSKTVLDLIEKLIKIKPKEWNNDSIFCSYDGNEVTTIIFDKRFQVYSKKCGYKITPYDLRHTFGTMYVQENGGNVFSLQKIMGHSNLNMTKRYMSVTSEQLKTQHAKATPLNNVLQRNTRVNKVVK